MKSSRLDGRCVRQSAAPETAKYRMGLRTPPVPRTGPRQTIPSFLPLGKTSRTRA